MYSSPQSRRLLKRISSDSLSKDTKSHVQKSSTLIKEAVNKRLIDSIVNSIIKRRISLQKEQQLLSSQNASDDKDDIYEVPDETEDGAMLEVSSFVLDHPKLDINEDKEWVSHYRQSQKRENKSVQPTGLLQSFGHLLRSTLTILNPFKRVEVIPSRIDPNPFIFVDGKKQVNPAYLDYVHYRKDHPFSQEGLRSSNSAVSSTESREATQATQPSLVSHSSMLESSTSSTTSTTSTLLPNESNHLTTATTSKAEKIHIASKARSKTIKEKTVSKPRLSVAEGCINKKRMKGHDTAARQFRIYPSLRFVYSNI